MSDKQVLHEDLFACAMKSLSEYDRKLEKEKINFQAILDNSNKRLESNLDAWDILLAIVFGGIGAIISENEKIADFCEKIHDIAGAELSENATTTEHLIHMLLGHNNDYMDKVPIGDIGRIGVYTKKYVSRSATRLADNVFSYEAPHMPHRMGWGHDIFSLGEDNPFLLLIGQYGFGQGIVQAIKHLLADTFSKQGLPIPGHSFFDYTDSNGTIGNYLFDLSKNVMEGLNISTKGCAFDLQAFNEMFSLHIQDIASQGLVYVLVLVYCKIRHINDDIRKTQFHLIAYFVNFYFSAIYGTIKNGGIPDINWVAFSMMVKNFIQLFVVNHREIRVLKEETNRLIESNIALEARVFQTGEMIISHDTLWEYVEDYEKEKESALALINFFEED